MAIFQIQRKMLFSRCGKLERGFLMSARSKELCQFGFAAAIAIALAGAPLSLSAQAPQSPNPPQQPPPQAQQPLTQQQLQQLVAPIALYPDALLARVDAAVASHVGETERSDDITMLALARE